MASRTWCLQEIPSPMPIPVSVSQPVAVYHLHSAAVTAPQIRHHTTFAALSGRAWDFPNNSSRQPLLQKALLCTGKTSGINIPCSDRNKRSQLHFYVWQDKSWKPTVVGHSLVIYLGQSQKGQKYLLN